MFGNFEIGKIFTKLVTSEKIRDLHLYLQFFFGDFSIFLRFCNICILYRYYKNLQKNCRILKKIGDIIGDLQFLRDFWKILNDFTVAKKLAPP